MSKDLLKIFFELDINKDAIGLREEQGIAYFCTPIGAEIIGGTGVDGIHFCSIPSLDRDMVFAVSPMPCGENYVEPVAYNFTDFLRLILTCGSAGPLEQISWIDADRFKRLIESENEIWVDGRDDALNTIKNTFCIEALPNAYGYVKTMQKQYDYSLIPYTAEYYDVMGIKKSCE